MSDYWQRRKAQQMFEYMAGAEETADQIAKLYLKASRYLEYKMKDIFERFRTKHNLSETEARRLLNQIYEPDKLAELKRRLAEKGEDKRAILTELESPAYRARIERLQQLNVQLDLVMRQVYEQEKIQHTAWYLELASEAYYHSIFEIQKQTGLAFSFALIDPKKIDRVINSKWMGANYSERIWKNTQALADTLKEELLVSIVTGRTERETAEIIANKFAVGASKARRLVRTESCYLVAQMDMESYKECGIEMYRFLATLDLKTSEMCRELDGRRFHVSEQEVGKNCPPMHSWCRSTTTGEVSDEELAELERRAIDPETGGGIRVPANMDYRQWYQKYVAGKPKAEANEKKLKNYAADRKQYERYRAVLGDDVPEKLDDFQQMKYTDRTKYEFMKLDYRRRKELIEHPNKKLPGADKAVAPDGKFTRYLFGGNNKEGLVKGENFNHCLGYNIENWEFLQKEICQKASVYPAISKGNVGFGEKYEQKMVLYGLKEKPANVVVGWICRPDGSVSMTSAYIKEVE